MSLSKQIFFILLCIFYAAHKNVPLTDDEKGEFKNLVFAYAESIGIDIIRESRKGASKEVALNHILEEA